MTPYIELRLVNYLPVVDATSGSGEVNANLEELAGIIGKGLGIAFCLYLCQGLVGCLVEFQF